jgi:hypothetical protein
VLLGALGSALLVAARRRRSPAVAHANPTLLPASSIDVPTYVGQLPDFGDPLLQALDVSAQRGASTAPAPHPVPSWVRRLAADVEVQPKLPKLRVVPADDLAPFDPTDDPDAATADRMAVAGPTAPTTRRRGRGSGHSA